MNSIPQLPGKLRKNDALFMFGAVQQKPFVYTYLQDSVEVVGGPSCKCETEIRTDMCERDGVPVRERRGGGGTVVLAPGMVVTIVVDDRPQDFGATDIFAMIHECMIGLLQERGIGGVTRSGISDLAFDDRKILGSSLYMGNRPFLYYYQSSIIVTAERALFTRYLTHPPREPEYRRGRNHDDFCTSFADAGFAVTAEELCTLFGTRLAGTINRIKTNFFPALKTVKRPDRITYGEP